MYDAAIAGAAPGPVTAAALRTFSAKPGQRIWIYALGKAAHPMAAATVAALQRALLPIAGGVVVSPEVSPSPHATLVSLEGNHPLPGRHSFTAAERIGDTAAGMRSDDVAIVLLSGGATSLVAAPLRGHSEADLGQLFELLLGSGLDIKAMNACRKRFTRWGAGRLALALAPARSYVYIVSDVLGDDPADICSGPCAPDPNTVKDVVALLTRTGILPKLSVAMRDYLTKVGRGVVPETPKQTHPAFAHVSTKVIASNRLALDAMSAYAATIEMKVERVEAPLLGEASVRGIEIADAMLLAAQQGKRGCVLWGGETTVQLTTGSPHYAGRASASTGALSGPDVPPIGGRCQELALAASKRLAQAGEAAARITILAAGTDGRDGTTEAAGAFADGDLWAAIKESGHDPELALSRHDSHAVLSAAGALLPRRFTGTNVMDVVIGLVE